MIPDAVTSRCCGRSGASAHAPGVRFHALGHPPGPNGIRRIAGVPVTTPERMIVESLEAGTQREQIDLGCPPGASTRLDDIALPSRPPAAPGRV